MDRKFGNLFRRAEPSHRLARDEGGAGLFIVAHGMKPVLQRWRLHSAGADRIAADALLHKIGGDGLGDADHGRFRGRIDEPVRHGGKAHDGRYIDDGPFALFQHARQESFNEAEHGAHIEVEGEIPFFLLRIENCTGMDGACHVEQDVDRTDFPWEGSDGGGIARVKAANRDPLDTLKLRQLFHVDIGRDDLRAFARKSLGARAADSLRRSGYERSFPLKPTYHIRSPYRFLRPLWLAARIASCQWPELHSCLCHFPSFDIKLPEVPKFHEHKDGKTRAEMTLAIEEWMKRIPTSPRSIGARSMSGRHVARPTPAARAVLMIVSFTRRGRL